MRRLILVTFALGVMLLVASSASSLPASPIFSFPTLPRASEHVPVREGDILVGLLPSALGMDWLTGRLYVANNGVGTGSISVIDAATDQVVATVPVGVSPSALAVDMDRQIVYVMNRGSDSVSVLDARTNTVTDTIPVGHRPAAMSFDADSQRLYVVNRRSDDLAVIDVGARREEQRIPVGKLPFALVVDAKANAAFVLCEDNSRVYRVDLASGQAAAIAHWDGLRSIAANPVAHRVYVSHQNGLGVIDTQTAKVVANISLPLKGALAVDVVRNVIYAAGHDRLYVVDGATLAASHIALQHQPTNLLVDVSNGRVYASHWDEGAVSIVNGETGWVDVVPVGQNPNALVLDQVTYRVYTANTGWAGDGNHQPGSVSVIGFKLAGTQAAHQRTASVEVQRQTRLEASRIRARSLRENDGHLSSQLERQVQSHLAQQSDGDGETWASHTQHEVKLSLLGQLGGSIKAVATQGQYAYVGVSNRLAVVDMTQPATPTLTGLTAPMSDYVQSVAVSGTHAYVAAGNAGLRVIDVSNPFAPVQVGFYDTSTYVQANSVAIAGDLVCLGDPNYLWLVSVADPAHPTQVGVYYTEVSQVTAVGEYAYVVGGTYVNSLKVISVTSPSTPTLVSILNTPGQATDVTVVGDYAYVADGYGGLAVVSIADKAHPAVTGVYDTPGNARSVRVLDDFALVADGGHGGMWVISVADKAHPSAAGFYPTFGQALAVDVAGAQAFLADDGTGLVALEMTDPTQPVRLGVFYSPQRPRDVTAPVGGLSYLSSGSEGMYVISMTNPARPVQVGHLDTAGYTYRAVASGGYAYLADGAGGLRIVSVLDPAHPVEVGYLYTSAEAQAIAYADDYVYVGTPASVQVISVTNKNQPVKVSETPYYLYGANDIAISGDFLYVLNSYYLYIYSIADRAHPIRVGYTSLSGYATALAVEGDYAYVASTTTYNSACNCYLGSSPNGDPISGLYIISIADKAHPTWVSYYQITSQGVNDVAIAGDYAYLTIGNVVYVISVEDKRYPLLAGYYVTPGTAFSVVATNGYVCVADDTGGLVILKPSRLLSLGINLAAGERSSSLYRAQFTGARYVLVPIAWAEWQPQPKQFNWNKLDRIVTWTRSYNLIPVLRVYRAPAWARAPGSDVTAPPVNPDDLRTAMQALTQRYGAQFAGYVIWNEPNLPDEWGGATPDAAAYITLLKAAYDGAKAANSSVAIVSAGLAPTQGGNGAVNDLTFLAQMYDAGLAQAADVIGMNGLGFAYAPDDTSDPNGLNFSRLAALRQVMVNKSDASHDAWALEVGWLRDTPIDLGGYNWMKVSPYLQGVYTLRAIQKAEQEWPWLDAIFIWNGDYDLTTPATDQKHWFALSEWGRYLAQNRQTPYPPILTRPMVCGVTNQARPAFEGTSLGAMTTTLLIDGQPTYTTATDKLFRFAITPTSDLAAGLHVISAQGENDYGETGGLSAGLALTVSPTLLFDPLGVALAYRYPGASWTGVRIPRNLDGCVDPAGWQLSLPPGVATTVTVPISCAVTPVVTFAFGAQIVSLNDSGGKLYQSVFTPTSSDAGGFAIAVSCGADAVTLSGVSFIDPDGVVYDATLGKSHPISDATVTCEWYDGWSWITWDAWNYPVGGQSQVNPQTTGANGYYSFLTPAGIYKLRVTHPGYVDYESLSMYVLDQPMRLDIPLKRIYQVYLPLLMRAP